MHTRLEGKWLESVSGYLKKGKEGTRHVLPAAGVRHRYAAAHVNVPVTSSWWKPRREAWRTLPELWVSEIYSFIVQGNLRRRLERKIS